MWCASLAPRGMHLSMLRCCMAQLRNVSGQVASSEPPFGADGYVFMHEFRRSSRKFSKLTRPHREIFVYLRMELNGISSIRVLHPRHLRLNARDTRDGRLLARCANKRRVGYILVPENYTFLARILFRGYDENTRVCGDLEGRNLKKGFLENLFSQIGLRS